MLLAFAVSLALSAAPEVAGRWEGDGFTLVLAEGGGGTISDGPGVPPERLTWKAAPGVLNLTQDGDTIPYQMKLANGAMTLTSVVLDRPITLKRVGAANAKTAPAPAQPQPPPMGKTTTPRQPAAPQAKLQPPTCEGACQHYLTCAKLGAENLQSCVVQCYASGVNALQLVTYVQLDCQQAIAVIVAAQLQALQAAQGAQGNGQRNTSSRCQGCVRSGSDCVWISQSDWGHGPNSPYSGAVSSCDADCCGM